MVRNVVLASCLCLALGCRSQTPTSDPFFGRTTIPPPSTGSAGPTNPDPYFASQPQGAVPVPSIPTTSSQPSGGFSPTGPSGMTSAPGFSANSSLPSNNQTYGAATTPRPNGYAGGTYPQQSPTASTATQPMQPSPQFGKTPQQYGQAPAQYGQGASQYGQAPPQFGPSSSMGGSQPTTQPMTSVSPTNPSGSRSVPAGTPTPSAIGGQAGRGGNMLSPYTNSGTGSLSGSRPYPSGYPSQGTPSGTSGGFGIPNGASSGGTAPSPYGQPGASYNNQGAANGRMQTAATNSPMPIDDTAAKASESNAAPNGVAENVPQTLSQAGSVYAGGRGVDSGVAPAGYLSAAAQRRYGVAQAKPAVASAPLGDAVASGWRHVDE